jgi:chromosome segregation ATPase
VISLKPLVFFGLLELIVLCCVAGGFFFWKWRVLLKEKQETESIYSNSKQSLENAIASLEAIEDDSGALRRDCLKGIQAMFQGQRKANPAHWPQASQAIFRLLDRKPKEHASALESASPAQPSVLGLDTGTLDWEGMPHSELEAIIAAQNNNLEDLSRYPASLADLNTGFAKTQTLNLKLVEHLRAIITKDGRFEALKQLVEKLEENNQEMDTMMAQLEREKHRFEPRIAALSTENHKLQRSLLHYKKQLENLVPEKLDLQAALKDMEKKMELRNKTYDRLHKKFEALRREYITLYERSAKGRPPWSTS